MGGQEKNNLISHQGNVLFCSDGDDFKESSWTAQSISLKSRAKFSESFAQPISEIRQKLLGNQIKTLLIKFFEQLCYGLVCCSGFNLC